MTVWVTWCVLFLNILHTLVQCNYCMAHHDSSQINMVYLPDPLKEGKGVKWAAPLSILMSPPIQPLSYFLYFSSIIYIHIFICKKNILIFKRRWKRYDMSLLLLLFRYILVLLYYLPITFSKCNLNRNISFWKKSIPFH